MQYSVLNIFPIGENTSVTIEGKGGGIRNNMTVRDSKGHLFNVLSVAMPLEEPDEIGKTTTVLIEGSFSSDVICL